MFFFSLQFSDAMGFAPVVPVVITLVDAAAVVVAADVCVVIAVAKVVKCSVASILLLFCWLC
jgi:hypothetical protein